jgi:ESCRT-II complex subunit VPS25
MSDAVSGKRAERAPSTFKGFQFPSHYDLPPFFTPQPTVSTRQVQLQMWADLILAYTKHFKIYQLDLLEAATSSPLFRNEAINRSVDVADARVYVEYMVEKELAEWVDKSKSRAAIYWRKPSEWASIMYKWALDRGKVGEVITLFDMLEGEDSEDQEFFGLPSPLALKCLDSLQKQKKALVFSSGNSEAVGVKFFM